MARILLVEDDASIIKNLTLLLQHEGFTVISAATAASAMTYTASEAFDLALLDLTLPDGNGYSICTAIKKTKNVPVIFLTASGDELNVVTGLDLGADDYIAKPFRPLELISRIKNVLRHYDKVPAVYVFEGLLVDTVKGTVTKHGQDLFLSALEYRLLLFFLNHKGQVLSRNVLLNSLWDAYTDYVNDNTLTVYIKRIREKIEDDPQNPKIIKTVRGLGYKAGE